MSKPLICLCLTADTIEKDLALVDKYRPYIDLVELRVDLLEDDERLNIRDFPALAKIPCILTIRRTVDGGKFSEGEAARSMLFARALAYASEDSKKNFAYVDFEEDFHISSLQDAAMAYGTKIIRSFHDMKNPIENFAEKLRSMQSSRFEIPKIAFMPHTLDDVTKMYKEMQKFKNSEQIVVAMGQLGLPSRILAQKFHSYLSYTSPADPDLLLSDIGQIDPQTLEETYNFHAINDETKIFGITGWPLKYTSSPKLHNAGFKQEGMNAVYIPFRAEKATEAFEFAHELGIKGFSVTIPHKEEIIKNLFTVEKKVDEIGACNTVINESGVWLGYNTDCIGFTKAVLEFTGEKNLKKKHVAIIGAGGAAKAIAYAVKKLGGKACIFNRTIAKARVLGKKYGFEYAPLGPESITTLKKYKDIIIQTTSKGMGSTEPSNEKNDPLWFYDFAGTEMIYDIVYEPEVTPIMARAKKAGCKVNNGYTMLKYQADEQFKLFMSAK
ncbi:type I 3-dehydroquinate dehydratase [uncultured Treponema sp.]|uniref:type I 3-dehydroquinate dehydratase n=1 Tax=uncultured Treponema sp. TaxID=162155 RepID=UPI0025DA8C9B|nr:type I 3-dehydroquinate dehydratase [uncultured Treponema sp.]